MEILSPVDLNRLYSLYRSALVFTQSGNLSVKKILLAKGLKMTKNSGSGFVKITLGKTKLTEIQGENIYLNFNDKDLSTLRIILAKSIIKAKEVYLSFEHFYLYISQDRENLAVLINQIHPEALALFNLCKGKGIDVGCGFRKTHPKAIGVDWVGKGEKGRVGNVKGRRSEADIQSPGDSLKMFKDNELDFVVARHNLEHYHNPAKTLKEWTRILKKDGYIGVIVPKAANPQTAEPTHYFDFNLEKLRQLFEENGKLKVEYLDECIKGWSFICIAKKIKI